MLLEEVLTNYFTINNFKREVCVYVLTIRQSSLSFCLSVGVRLSIGKCQSVGEIYLRSLYILEKSARLSES